MLVGTITDAWSAISKIGSGTSLPSVPQAPLPTTYPLPVPTVQPRTSAPTPTTLSSGRLEISVGPNWKMIGLVAGSVAVLGTAGYFLLRKPRRRRRRR